MHFGSHSTGFASLATKLLQRFSNIQDLVFFNDMAGPILEQVARQWEGVEAPLSRQFEQEEGGRIPFLRQRCRIWLFWCIFWCTFAGGYVSSPYVFGFHFQGQGCSGDCGAVASGGAHGGSRTQESAAAPESDTQSQTAYHQEGATPDFEAGGYAELPRGDEEAHHCREATACYRCGNSHSGDQRPQGGAHSDQGWFLPPNWTGDLSGITFGGGGGHHGFESRACQGQTGSFGGAIHGLCYAGTDGHIPAISTDGGTSRRDCGTPSCRRHSTCRSFFTSKAQTSCSKWADGFQGRQGTLWCCQGLPVCSPERLTLWQNQDCTAETPWRKGRWYGSGDTPHGQHGLIAPENSYADSWSIGGRLSLGRSSEGFYDSDFAAPILSLHHILDVNETLRYAHTSEMTVLLWIIGLLALCFTGLVEITPNPFSQYAAPRNGFRVGRSLSRALFQVAQTCISVMDSISFCGTVSVYSTQPTSRRGGSLRWRFLFLLLGLCCGLGGASEDETVRQNLRQRALAMQGQDAALTQARWTWTYQHYGLPMPPLRGFYDCVIHRADTILERPTSRRSFHVQQTGDPIPLILSFSQLWNDVEAHSTGRISWQLHEGHVAIRRSTELQRDCRHFILVTDQEDNLHPSSVAIFLEIIWTGPTTVDFSVTIPWLTARTTTLRVLEQAGLLTACTTSHRCDFFHNGDLKTDVGLSLAHGHFIQIEGFLTTPPSSSEDEHESPNPISGIRSPSTSTTSAESSSSMVSTTESSEDAAPEEYTQLIHIYRPGVGTGRPSHVPALVPPGSRTWRTSVLVAWPLLRYRDWDHADIHQSFYLDYPQEADVIYKVLIVQQDLPTTLHQVIFVVLHWQRHTLQQALTLPPRSTPGHVLAALDLLPWCGPLQDKCGVSLNGITWSPERITQIFHGMYVRVRLRGLTSSTLGPHLAAVFNLEDELHAWSAIDAIGLARLRGDRQEATTLTPGPFPAPAGRTLTPLHEGYWIWMGLLMILGTFGLLKRLCVAEPRLPPKARFVAGQRRSNGPTQAVAGCGKAWLCLYLVMSQPGISAGLQFHPLPIIASEAPAAWTFAAPPISPAHNPPFLDTFARLPPPGNPSGSGTYPDIICRSNLTATGNLMCMFLHNHCGLLALHRRFTLPQDDAGQHLTARDLRPVPTPARSGRLPVHVGRQCLEPNFDGQVRTSNGDPFPTGGLPDLLDTTQDCADPIFARQPTTAAASSNVSTTCTLSCDERTLNDLFTSWDCPDFVHPAHNGQVPQCLNEIFDVPPVDIARCEALEIYTDGSHGQPLEGTPGQTTWAFAILGPLAHCGLVWRLCGDGPSGYYLVGCPTRHHSGR